MAGTNPRGQQQQQQWRGPDLLITSFEAPDTVKPGETFVIVAVVAYRRHTAPRDTQHVIFEVGGTEIGEEPTDGEGRASVDHALEAAGTHILAAQIRGIPVSRRTRRIVVKAEDPELARIRRETELAKAKSELAEASGKPAVPARLIVSVSGSRGEQKLIISVAGEDGRLIPNRLVTVTDGPNTCVVDTDEDGTAIHPMQFTEPSRYAEVRAGGAVDLIWRGRLLGPRRPVQPPLFSR